MIYRFGDFELDAERETLTGPGGPVPLRDHALLVLKLLVERAPAVVTRDEILDEVWGHQALSESSIAQVIREIRKALGDSARESTHVATRYGRGYQFVGDVERFEAAPSAPGEGIERASRPARRADRTRTLALMLALVALLGGWQWFRGQPSLPTADAGDTIRLRAVAPEAGESLSAGFVNYLAFVLESAVGADRVEVVRDPTEPEAHNRIVNIALASLESGDSRQLELTIVPAGRDSAGFRSRFDEASRLVRNGLDEVFEVVSGQVDSEIRVEAGLLSQSSFAVETLLRGMAAQFAGDVQRAAELFEAALAEDPDFEFARYELAIAVRRNGDHERAVAILQPMAERLESDFWSHRIHNAMGIALWRMARYDEALVALRRAESAARAPATRAIVLTNIGLLERNLDQLDQAEATVRQAVRLATAAESPRIEAGARNTLASVLMRLDRDDEALQELELSRELFYDTGNLRGYGSVLSRSARIHAARGEFVEAESLLRLALGVRERIGDEAGIADIQFRLARFHRIRGEFEIARHLARSALERAQTLENDSLLIDCYRALAELALAGRRLEQARVYGAEALRLSELTGRDRDRRASRLILLESDLQSDVDQADLASRLFGLIAEADDADHRAVSVRARLVLARNFLALQRPDDARRALDRAGEFLVDDLPLRHELDAARARMALDRGDYAEASRALEALEGSNASPYPLLVLKAKLQAERGNLTLAIETAGLARSTIGDWWSAEHQAMLDRWQAALSSGSPARTSR